MIAACTIVSENYLAFAKNLAYSFKKYNSQDDFYILVVDEYHEHIYNDTEIYKILNVNQLNINNFKEWAFKYNIVELDTAVKPFFIEYLYNNYEYDKVLYIDPDMMVFSSFEELYKKLDDYSVVLTPHILYPYHNKGELKDNQFLLNGIYNLGFLGTKNDKNTMQMLKWWQIKLSEECFLEYDKGLAVDQKWMDFAPALFEGVHIFRHPGYNMAFWNIHERKVTNNGDPYLVNGEYKLCLYHFSSFKMAYQDYIIKSNHSISLKERPDLQEIYSLYYDGVKRNDFENHSKTKYKYNYFNNGIQIEYIHRRLYSKLNNKKFDFNDPFDTLSKNTYYEWLSTEGYISNASNENKDLSSNNNSINSSKVTLIKSVLRFLRKCLGINRYTRLIKKLNWLSNIDNHYRLYLMDEKK